MHIFCAVSFAKCIIIVAFCRILLSDACRILDCYSPPIISSGIIIISVRETEKNRSRQFKIISTCSGESIIVLHRLSEVSPMLLLNQLKHEPEGKLMEADNSYSEQ